MFCTVSRQLSPLQAVSPTRGVSPQICDTLTPDNSMVVFHHWQGDFVSPMRAALYARVSTHDQQTLAMQRDALHEFATRRGWTVIDMVEEIASGAKDRRPKRQALLRAAKQRKLDVILVWKLDRWGRSLVDLMTTLHELTALGVGFASLTEALDLTTPAGRAFAGFLAVFAEFERDLIRSGFRPASAMRANAGRHMADREPQ